MSGRIGFNLFDCRYVQPGVLLRLDVNQSLEMEMDSKMHFESTNSQRFCKDCCYHSDLMFVSQKFEFRMRCWKAALLL